MYSLGKLLNDRKCICFTQSFIDFFISRIWASVQKVLSNSLVEEYWLLPHVSYLASVMLEVEGSEVEVVDEDASMFGVVKSFEELDDGAFAWARWANNCCGLALVEW